LCGRPFFVDDGAMKRALPLLLLLSACDREPQPEPPTAGENAQLDEADAMLDALANEEGAAPNGTAPTENSN
jgi:hypothetical protein